MRRPIFVFLIFLVILICCPAIVQAQNLTYASDYYLQGNDLVNSGQYEEALQAYQTARSMDEVFYDQHYGISYQIGWVLDKLGRYDEALSEFQIAEKYRPEWVAPFAVYYNEGCVLAKLGRNDEALQAFNSALLIQNTNWYVLFNKGIVLERMGRYQEAVTAFDSSRKAYATYLPLLGSYQEASSTYDKAQGNTSSVGNSIPEPTETIIPQSVASDAYDQETSVDSLMRTGEDFAAQYQYENALVVFDRVLTIDPGNYHAMLDEGDALANLGRYPESLQLYTQAITYLDKDVDPANYDDAYYGRAWVQAKMGNYTAALNDYHTLFTNNPDDFRGHYDNAWVLAQLGNYDEAVQEYNRSLDWENQITLNTESYTILGPLGTYQDVANAYNQAPGTSYSATVPSDNVVLYHTDFSSDPLWQTPRPDLYYWDATNQTYHFRSDPSSGYAEVLIPYNGTAFQLEYDISIPHADPGSLVRFGLSQYNTSADYQKNMVSYDSQNVILGEFKSWTAGQYQVLKNGDKTFQVFAIDNNKHVTDPSLNYQGICRINREQDITIPSFGDNRVYHVVIEFDPDKQTISCIVTDNLHETTYYDCTNIYAKVGTFNDMSRIILVAEPAENAYIEGWIANVTLYQTQNIVSSATPGISSIPSTPAPDTASLAVTPVTATPAATLTQTSVAIPGILNNPQYIVPVFAVIAVVIVLLIVLDRFGKFR